MIISAVGLADPRDQRYQADKSLLNTDLRLDSKSQLVEKAIALYLDQASLIKNYDLIRDRLLSRSGAYFPSILQEDEPRLGKDGLMHVTTQAAVKVREIQKSLNKMSRDERIEFIRNNGDPKISVAISVSGDGPEAPPQNSQVAQNLLKERIKSFGFRIWSDDGNAPPVQGKGADFAVIGEAKLKRLSARLAASGITVDKYVLTSWTVKCVNKDSGEEIYYNNKLPVGAGSWAQRRTGACRYWCAKLPMNFHETSSRSTSMRADKSSHSRSTACRTKASTTLSRASSLGCNRLSRCREGRAAAPFMTYRFRAATGR